MRKTSSTAQPMHGHGHGLAATSMRVATASTPAEWAARPIRAGCAALQGLGRWLHARRSRSAKAYIRRDSKLKVFVVVELVTPPRLVAQLRGALLRGAQLGIHQLRGAQLSEQPSSEQPSSEFPNTEKGLGCVRSTGELGT